MKKNLIGERFGRLMVIEDSGKRSKYGYVIWRCLCKCGNITLVRSSHLIGRNIKSCGCYNKEAKTKHGHSTGKPTKTYNVYYNMMKRGYRTNNVRYKDYGGRGIFVCRRWRKSFQNFLKDMGECPPGMSIDRHPDNNGSYGPWNCRWATPRQQISNQRKRKLPKLKYNLRNKKFGRLFVVGITRETEGVYWKCRCDCGTEVNVKTYSLRSGHTKSCGCFNRDVARETMKKNRRRK